MLVTVSDTQDKAAVVCLGLLSASSLSSELSDFYDTSVSDENGGLILRIRPCTKYHSSHLISTLHTVAVKIPLRELELYTYSLEDSSGHILGHVFLGTDEIRPIKHFTVSSIEKYIQPYHELGIHVYRLGENPQFPYEIIAQPQTTIFDAHLRLAKSCCVPYFLVMDDDYIANRMPLPSILEGTENNAIFYATNPYNGLVYGHGGMKLFATSSFYGAQVDITEDMTLKLSKDLPLTIFPTSYGTHRFGSTPFRAFSGAVREVVKLRRIADTDKEAASRLQIWTNSNHYPNNEECQSVFRAALFGATLPLDYPINDFNVLFHDYAKSLNHSYRTQD